MCSALPYHHTHAIITIILTDLCVVMTSVHHNNNVVLVFIHSHMECTRPVWFQSQWQLCYNFKDYIYTAVSQAFWYPWQLGC